MTKITITEALSEINLVKKKIEAKRNEITPYVTRTSASVDPFEKDGGSAAKISREMQSLHDLIERLSVIRSRISEANLKNSVTIDGATRSISDWLTWKREIYEAQNNFLANLKNTIQRDLSNVTKNPPAYRDEKGEPKFATLIINMDLEKLSVELQKNAEIYQKLDGQLSLKNATITVEI